MENVKIFFKEIFKENSLKKTFFSSFDRKINKLDTLQKWEIYKKIIGDIWIWLEFMSKIDFAFVLEQLQDFMTKSNLHSDFVHQHLSEWLSEYIRAILKKWFEKGKREKVYLFLKSFWELLKRAFYDSMYNTNTTLYKSFENNAILLEIVFYLILWSVRGMEEDEIENLKRQTNPLLSDQRLIYQFLVFGNIDREKFNKHLILLALIVILLENDSRLTIQLKPPQWYLRSYGIVSIFNIVNLKNWKITYYLKTIEEYWLLFTFLAKLKIKDWIDDNFKKEVLKVLLSENLVDDDILIDFSILLSKYKEIKDIYLEKIKNKMFKKSKILENLTEDKGLLKDTIYFLLIKENGEYINQKYISKKIYQKLKNVLIEKLKYNLTLFKGKDNNPYFNLLYFILIDKKDSLGINISKFEKDGRNFLIEEVFNDLDSYRFVVENIDKIISKRDLKNFYYLFLKKYIETYNKIGDEFNISDIKEKLWFSVKTIKTALNRLKKDWILEDWRGIGSYKIVNI